jgi:antirestriction protein ArdC
MHEKNKLMKEIEANLKDLASETDNVRKSDFFRQYLDTMSKFWQYSCHNQLLIYFQMPEATRVAGFVRWNQLGRHVKKGCKSIKILAPFVKKVTEIDEKTQLESEKQITGFFPVSVFDISQTQGRELPDIEISVSGDNHKDLLDKLVAFCQKKGIKVGFKKLFNGLYGYSRGGEIAVSSTESVNSQVNIMIHEIAHELLHQNSELSKQQKEIQAEATAYVVTRHFGIENRSFNYLALYDADYRKIMDNLKAVAEVSKQIIESAV